MNIAADSIRRALPLCLPRTGRLRSAIVVCAIVAAGGPSVARADADMHTLRIEGGLAIPVTDPQTSRFDFGGGAALSYELRPASWFGIEARITGYWLASSHQAPSRDGYGGYIAPSIGIRLHPLASLGVGDLWVSAVGAVVFTGDVIRPGLEVGLGYEFDMAWWLRIGPFIRYHHVFQTVPGADAGFLSVGLSASLGGTEPARDSDGDGILDVNDTCPREPEDFDSWEDTDGCPDTDNDADGVLDGIDGCPNVAEDRDGFEDGDGCPDEDDDQDGIPDATDACPRVAEDRDDFEDGDGCPEVDNDQDGILDAADGCPNEPETMNGYQDEDGCPDVAPPPPPPPRTETEIRLDQLGERIQFPQNRTRVLANSRASLREVIVLLRTHPEILRVTIEAHASAEGETDANMALSQRRAEAVITALVRGGIARDRLVARAYGEARPEVAGDSEEELAANRRVVFIVEHAVVVPTP